MEGSIVPKNKFSVLAAGDMVPTRSLFAGAQALTPEFQEVVDLVNSADLAVCTVDIALTTRGYPREKLIALRTGPEVAPDVRRLGFSVVSVANNHSMDYGETGLLDTLDAYEGAGLHHVGGGADLDKATAPAVIETNGWRVGVLGWTCLLPTGAAASPDRPGQSPLHVHTAYEVNPYLLMEEPGTAPTVRTRVDEVDLAAAARSIGALRERADFIVALVHWGGGLTDVLAEYQRPLGKALLDAGADVVVGSHPHRVHGIEKHGDKVIFYSPGTLIEQLSREGADAATLAVYQELSPDSFMALLEISPDGKYEVRLIPASLGAEGVPGIARGKTLDRIAQRVTRMSAELGTAVEAHDGGLKVGSSGVRQPVL